MISDSSKSDFIPKERVCHSHALPIDEHHQDPLLENEADEVVSLMAKQQDGEEMRNATSFQSHPMQVEEETTTWRLHPRPLIKRAYKVFDTNLLVSIWEYISVDVRLHACKTLVFNL